jgi:hypothetical protein
MHRIRKRGGKGPEGAGRKRDRDKIHEQDVQGV